MSVPTVVREETFDASATGAASIPLTLANAVPVGNTLLVPICIPSGQTVSTVADSQGNTWVQDASTSSGGGLRVYWYSCRVTTALGNGDTITITPSASVAWHVVTVLQVSGRVAAVVQAAASSNATSTSPSGNQTPSSVADSISFGAIGWISGNTGDLSSLTSGTQDSLRGTASGSLLVAHVNQSAQATMTANTISATLGTTRAWLEAIVTYRGQTRRYVDYSKTDNTLSGLSWANAKKDIASAGALSGDLVTVAKSADPAAMSGTCAFVDNSASVSTSVDISATAVAKSMIGAATDGSKGWWEVSSVTSTTITLVAAYAGTTETVTGYKLGVSDAGSPATAGTVIAGSGTSGIATDHVTVTGGYNTGSDLRDGYTHYWVSGATKNGVITISNTFNDWSYIGIWRSSNGFTNSVNNTNCDHVQGGATSSSTFNGIGNSNSTLSNVVCTASGVAGIVANGGTFANQNVTNATILHPATRGIQGYAGTQVYVLTSVAVNRPGTDGAQLGGIGRVVGCTFKNCGSGVGTSSSGTVGFMQWANCTFGSGNSSADVTGNQTCQNVYYSCSFLSSTVISTVSSGPDVIMDRYQQTQGAYRRYVAGLAIVLTNTANSRSGTCMELQYNSSAPVTGTQDGYLEQVFPIPGQSGVQRTVSIYVAKSSGWNGDTGSNPPSALGLTGGQLKVGLRWNGDWVSGSPDVTRPTTSYAQRQFTYTPSEDGTIELVVQAGGTAGSIYLDDVSWS